MKFVNHSEIFCYALLFPGLVLMLASEQFALHVLYKQLEQQERIHDKVNTEK